MKNWTLIFLIALTACTKSKYYPIDSTFKSTFNYKQGTYWIYKDSLSGDIDSFFVRGNHDYVTNNDQDTYESISIYISEYIVSSPSLDTSSWIINLSAHNSVALEWDQSKSIPYINQDFMYNPLFEYPFKIGALPSVYSLIGIVTNVFPTYSISANIFDDVAEIHDTAQNPMPNGIHYINDWFYFSKDVGIIKMRLYHPTDSINRVWVIQRWSIKK